MSLKSLTSGILSKTVQRLPQRRFMRTNPQASSNQLPVANPATGDIIKVLDCDSKQSVDSKFAEAKNAQKSWNKVPLSERKKIIARYGELLQENVDDIARTLSSEMGKPVSQAKGEAKGVQPRINFFLENVDSVIQTRVEKEKGNIIEQVTSEPLGVIANISAWNYPLFVGNNVLVPALLTGNAVLYKPSEYSTMTGLKMIQLLHKAGVPEQVLRPVVGKGDIAEHLLTKDLNGVFFTGSNATGAKIAQKVAGKMVRLQLELGGKDPTYVCDDADVESAAKSLADGANYNTGQSCCSVERIYVHTKIYNKFVEIFVNEVKAFKMGDPLQDGTYIGALALAKQPDFLEAQVKDAVAKGAKILVGGHKGYTGNEEKLKRGHWFQPTVLVNVNHTMDVMREESFGPIIGIMEVKSDEEAVKLMNDTKYGLTAGVYTPSKIRAEDVLSQVESGTVYWNACDRVAPCLPWSGRRGSGIGSTLGREGIQTFVQPKAWHLIGK
eukprot:TRINITY_DN1009_c0_g1_i1.p1 TRINITY_DN1009_c0_g1~~TRINITY_DN1009_c0_g1_i1.p1  ORF type:complete len:496 (+),score=129.56 TRINITY_DN1009_c0_g1_i1:110-1597(+)